MNFLAHLYLSGSKKEIILGNFIADHVKGRAIEKFSTGIRSGIRLHRLIDYYTDHHPIVKHSIKILTPTYYKYSSVIVDMYYDHFLARNWSDYSNVELKEFVASAYRILIENFAFLPPRTKKVLPHMVTENWLVNYASLEKMKSYFQQMSTRTRFNSGMENAVKELVEYYPEFEKDFREFFPLLNKYISNFDFEGHLNHFLPRA